MQGSTSGDDGATTATRAAALLLALVLACAVATTAHSRTQSSGTAVKVTLTAPTHGPKIGAKWLYAVRATAGGKPAAGRITAQIVDPIGGVHPVDFAGTKKPTSRLPFKGVFRDYVLWPAESRGVPLTFRVTVVVAGTKKTLVYRVTPHS